MTTIRQELETIEEDLKRAYSRLGRFRKMDAMVKHWKALKIIRDRLWEDIEVLREFIERNF